MITMGLGNITLLTLGLGWTFIHRTMFLEEVAPSGVRFVDKPAKPIIEILAGSPVKFEDLDNVRFKE